METLEQRITNIEQNMTMVGLAAKDVLTASEASCYLGLSMSYLYKLTSAKQIPHYKTGKLCYFDRAELNAWVKQNRVSTTEEIEVAAQSYCLKNGIGSRNVKSAK